MESSGQELLSRSDNQTGEVPLPENRPGRIAVVESSSEQRKAHQRSVPLSKSQDELREMALAEAQVILPNELAMMLPPANPAYTDLVALCGEEDTWQGFAALLVDLLWAPLAGCVPRLGGLNDGELLAKLQLFWRCAVALFVMPLAQLSLLSRRKAAFMPSIKDHLPADDAPTPDSRIAHIRLNLPLFAMVADSPTTEKPKVMPKPECLEKSDANEPSPKEGPQSPSQPLATTETKPAETGPRRIDARENEQRGVNEKSISSAARHTYDVGYKKWENFDVDAELKKVDKPAPPKPKEQLVDMNSFNSKSTVAGLDFDDPVKALDQAIKRAQENENNCVNSDSKQLPTADSEILPDTKTVPTTKSASLSEQYRRWEKFDVKSSDEEDNEVRREGLTKENASSSGSEAQTCCKSSDSNNQVVTEIASPSCEVLDTQLTQDGVVVEELQTPKVVSEIVEATENTTAASLNNDYKKWNDFDPDEEMDDISDEDDLGGDMDLDALTGPKDEVARIQRHWKREAAACRRQKRKEAEEQRRALRQAQIEARDSLPEGSQVQRPCVYRPSDDPETTAAKAIRRDYNKWKDFDVDAAILELDNEGKTQEGDAMRCSAKKGSAMVMAEGYTKDKEEFELDKDIEQQMGSLKKVIGQRLKDAAALKAEGNTLLRNGRAKDACRVYEEGLATMDLCEQASVIMADSMADKNLRLVADLHRNMAAAQLQLEDFEGARKSCDAALKLTTQRKDDCGNQDGRSDDDKALYRRAFALLRLGRNQDARRDIESLSSILGENDAAVKKLRALDRPD